MILLFTYSIVYCIYEFIHIYVLYCISVYSTYKVSFFMNDLIKNISKISKNY